MNTTRHKQVLIEQGDLSVDVDARIAKARRQVRRVDGKTLDALCAALGVGPGELLEYVPEQRAKRSRG